MLTCLQVFWNLLGAGILALTAPILAHGLTYPGLLGLFAGLNLVCWAAVFFLVPETTRIGLEDLNKICKPLLRWLASQSRTNDPIVEIRTMTHIRYRIQILKWTIGKRDEPDPFHLWAEKERTESQQSSD